MILIYLLLKGLKSCNLEEEWTWGLKFHKCEIWIDEVALYPIKLTFILKGNYD